MEEQKEEARHTISVLTELVLYKRIKAFDEDDTMDDKIKEENKKQAIEVFVDEYANKTNELSIEEIREIVIDVLDRTERHSKGDYR